MQLGRGSEAERVPARSRVYWAEVLEELAAFAQAVGASPTKQIVLVLDRAGWHASGRLRVPEHVHLLFLPPYSPSSSPPSISGR